MKLSRRGFIQSAGYSLIAFFQGLSSLPILLWRNVASAGENVRRRFARVRADENLFMAFNNIKNPENGESDEFTTIRNVQAVLDEMKVPAGTNIIGIGARTGHANDPYALPGEMGYLWKKGEAWNAKVTSPVDASPMPLRLDDPIIVTQVGVLHDHTAHHFEIDDPSLEGSCLWTMYNDETGSPTLGVGMHNLFSDVDGGLLEQIYETTQDALKDPDGWATERARNKLKKFMPNLANPKIWANFSATLANPFVHSRWRSYVRRQGWEGAAIVLKGSMENVTQFHLKEWVRKSPAEPEFEIGKGTHTFLKIRAGREAKPFITNASGDWTMVGFIWDLENRRSTPEMSVYRDFSDIFGQDFHIHGFKDDGSVGGHTLFALLGSGKLSVSLYPLAFERDETAFLFNNDLKLLPQSIVQGSDSLSVEVHNSGMNFVRNVSVRLSRRVLGRHADIEDIVIPMLRPGQVVRLRFKGKAALSSNGKRTLWLDRDGHFLEGGEGTKNNRVDF